MTRIPLSDEADPFDDGGSDLCPDASDVLDELEAPDALDFNGADRLRNPRLG